MYNKLNRLVTFVTSIGFWPAYMVYVLLAKRLPQWAAFSSTHIWWHNILLAVFWLGLYLVCFYGVRRYVRQQMEMFNKRAWYSHEMKMFSRWSKWLCLIAVFGFVLIPYLELPAITLLATGGCGVAVIVYDIIKAGWGAPFIILQQFYLSVLTAAYYILFSPILLALYVIMLGLLVFGIGLGDLFSPQIMVTTYYNEDGTYQRTERENV